jgi:hypothetical protein
MDVSGSDIIHASHGRGKYGHLPLAPAPSTGHRKTIRSSGKIQGKEITRILDIVPEEIEAWRGHCR